MDWEYNASQVGEFCSQRIWGKSECHRELNEATLKQGLAWPGVWGYSSKATGPVFHSKGS